MKKFRGFNVVLVLALMLALMPSSASAQGPSGTWVSGITCQNLDDTFAAEVVFDFYREGEASAALSYLDSIPAGGTLKYFTPSSPAGLPAPFTGSVTVSSSTALTCNVNTQSNNTGTSSSPFRAGTSAGFDSSQVAPIIYLPQVIKQAGTAPVEWNSYIAVQNTSANPVTVDVKYYDKNTGAEIVAAKETYTIAANSNKIVYQKSNANLPVGFNGGAKVVATSPNTTPLAAVVNFYNSGSSYITAQFQSYNGYGAGRNKLFIPRVMRKYYGYNSGITIQNVSPSVPTTVTIDFKFKDGSTYSYTSPSILPGASIALYSPGIAELAGVDALPYYNRSGSAVVRANAVGGLIVGNVNEDNSGDANYNIGNPNPIPEGDKGKGSTYGAFLDGNQTNSVFIAQIPKKAGLIYTGGIIISNTTDLAGTCDFAFVGYPSLTGVTLPASGMISLYAANITQIPNGYNSSVLVTCTQPVFGLGNFSVEGSAGKYGDSYVQYNAYNQ